MRENNVIMYDIPESNEESRTDIYTDDLNRVRDELNKIRRNISVKKIFRLGKRTNNPRPIKVILESSNDAIFVLKNKNKITDHRLKSDDTPMQQGYLKKIRLEIQERKNNGELNLTIKYTHNVPKIVTNRKNFASPNSQLSQNN